MKPGQHIIITTNDSHIDGIIVSFDRLTNELVVNDEIGTLITDSSNFMAVYGDGVWVLEA